jgi:hypothetical protein
MPGPVKGASSDESAKSSLPPWMAEAMASPKTEEPVQEPTAKKGADPPWMAPAPGTPTELDHAALTELVQSVEQSCRPPVLTADEMNVATEMEDSIDQRPPAHGYETAPEVDVNAGLGQATAPRADANDVNATEFEKICKELAMPDMDIEGKPYTDDAKTATSFEQLCKELSSYGRGLGAADDRKGQASNTRESEEHKMRIFKEDLKVAEQIAKTRGCPPPLKQVDVPPFLLPYGYDVIDHRSWAKSPEHQPKVNFELKSHVEFGDHTQYEFINKVCPKDINQPADISWRTIRRLKHLRSGLHDVVKSAMGSTYKHYFGGTPFALHGAPRGTTARLQLWFQSLSSCINSGVLEPQIVAATYRLLDGPGTPLYSEGANTFYTPDQIQQLPVTAALFGSKNKPVLPRVALGKPLQAIKNSPNGGRVVEIVFLVDGQKHNVHCVRQPLGAEFGKRQGETLKLSRVHANMHAEELGLQVGWEVVSVEGEMVDALSFQEASILIKEKIAQLPKTPMA